MANSGWTVTTIGELCDKGVLATQTGPFGSQLHSYDYVASGIPVIPTEAIGRRRLQTEGIPQIAPETAARLARHRVRSGDILFARRGVQATGHSALVTEDQTDWICGTGAILLRIIGGNLDPTFLSFHLSSEVSFEWLRQHAVGAVMPNLNEQIIRGVPLWLPPPREQRAIANILGVLDDKIELNRRMNETLEGLARAIFQSWFVDFDPVRAQRDGLPPPALSPTTAALFPDRFQDSELGKIPKGWKVGCIGDVGSNPRRTINPENIKPGTPYIALEHMPRRSIALADWSHGDEIASGKCQFHRGEILFGKLRPYFHKVGVPAIDGVCSTDILVVVPKSPAWFGFLLGQVSSDELIAFTDMASTGTKMPRTSWSDISRYQIVLPPESIAKVFSSQVRELIAQIHANIRESHTLAAIRDALLPKLLSGEIRVAEAERLVEDAGWPMSAGRMAERCGQNDGRREMLREFVFIVLPPSFCNS